MYKIPALSGRELIRFLESVNFIVIRTRGSHVRLRSADGRVTTVPVHANDDLPKGLLRKIIRDDLEMSLADFLELYTKHTGK